MENLDNCFMGSGAYLQDETGIKRFKEYNVRRQVKSAIPLVDLFTWSAN